MIGSRSILSSLHLQRQPLAVLAMVFVLANLLLPGAMARAAVTEGASWTVLCSELAARGGGTLAALDCERCCLTENALGPVPVSAVAGHLPGDASTLIGARFLLTFERVRREGCGPRAPPLTI
jgi:hypothetical protein